MRLERLTLRCRDLEGQRDLFVDRLGFEPTSSAADQLALRVGYSSLIFQRDPEWTGTYHYALRVPGHRFDDAHCWLEQQVPLLGATDGQRVFHFEAWNAHGVYFADADGNIAELIARHALADPSEGPFAASSLVGLAEIGLVTDDVPGTVAQLGREYGLKPQFGQTDPAFTAVGDAGGLIIVVKRDRPWLPTDLPATPAPFTLTFGVSDRPGELAWRG